MSCATYFLDVIVEMFDKKKEENDAHAIMLLSLFHT